MSGMVSTIVTVGMLGGEGIVGGTRNEGGRYARGYVGRCAECAAVVEDVGVGRAGGGKYARGYVGRAGCTTGGEDGVGGRAGGGKYARGYVGRCEDGF